MVFDLDGTLIDSRQDLANSVNEMLGSYGAAPLSLEAVTGMIGDGARQLVERALAAASVNALPSDALVRFLSIYDRRLLEQTRPYPGLVDVVRAAATRASLALITNKPETPSRRLLEAFGICDCFQWVIGGDSGFAKKPDPASLRHVIRLAAATPLTTLFVGDSHVDIETARNAGTRMCAVLYGFGEVREAISWSGDDLIAPAPGDVGPIIERFLAGGH
ncbi:MAG: HAD-IA family hydrolase [Acidobacteriota bacterium]